MATVRRPSRTRLGAHSLRPRRAGSSGNSKEESSEDIGERAAAFVRTSIQMLVIEPVQSLCVAFYAVFLSRTSHRIVLRTVVLGILHLICIALAFIAYGSFYYYWVPDISVNKDVWLQYTAASDAPYANVLLDGFPGDRPVWQRDALQPLFAADQEYDVSLELRVPVNEVNMDFGNFLVQIELLSSDDKLLYQSSRPVLLVPEPRTVRWLSRAARSFRQPWRFEPIAPPQVIRVPMLHNIVPRSTNVRSSLEKELGDITARAYLATRAYIRIGRSMRVPNPVYEGETAMLQVQHAVLHFDAHLKGAPYVGCDCTLTQLLHVLLPNYVDGGIPHRVCRSRDGRGRIDLGDHSDVLFVRAAIVGSPPMLT